MTLRLPSRRRLQRLDPRVQSALMLAQQLLDHNSEFDVRAINARDWQVVPLVLGLSIKDQANFLDAARTESTDFVLIDLELYPLTCSVEAWTNEAIEKDKATYTLRISCSQNFALLSYGLEFSYLAGPPSFLKQCFPLGVAKEWHYFLEYTADPVWPPKSREHFDHIARIYGAPQTIAAFTHVDPLAYALKATSARARALDLCREAVEAPGGFKRQFLRDRNWDTIPYYHTIDSSSVDILLNLTKEHAESTFNIVVLDSGEPMDVMQIKSDGSVLWRIILKYHDHQLLIYPTSEEWIFFNNDVPCHIFAAKPALAANFAQEFNTSWQNIQDNRNAFRSTRKKQLQYNDFGIRYSVPDWTPFTQEENINPPFPARSLLSKLLDFFGNK